MPKRLSDEIRQKIIDLYVNDRLGVSEIQRRLRVGTTTALNALERAGIERRRDTRAWSRPGGQRFSAALCREIADKYAAGVSSSELQSHYNCCADVIRRAVTKSGGAMRPVGGKARAFSSDEIQRMKELWASGLSKNEVANTMGVSSGAVVTYALRAHGITIENRRRRGENHQNWTGGRTVAANGYSWVTVPPGSLYFSMRNTTGYVPEHRLVMAQSLGRPLTSNETVHHINGDKADNRLENLQLRRGKHGKHEAHRCRACGSYDIETVSIADRPT